MTPASSTGRHTFTTWPRAWGLALVLSASALLAQDVDPNLAAFKLSGDYQLIVDGQAASGDIYYSEHAGALLIQSSAFPSPVLLRPRANTAETVNVMKVMKKEDGSIDLLRGAVLAAQGSLSMTGDSVSFTADKKKGELKPKGPLLGLRTVYEVTAHNPEYLVSAKNYQPNSDAISSLRNEKTAVTVRVYYGSWCPHCRLKVPHAVKDEQLLKGSQITFQYWGVPQKFGTDPEAQRLKLEAVPTGIVYIQNKEIGRIEAEAWDAPEVRIEEILANRAKAH
jgi:hypothetical protein